jgi:LPXTG-motif cell wall-anchored protein
MNSNRRRVVAGIGTMVAGAALLVGALPGGAGAAPTQETTVTSEQFDGNPTCGDLSPEGTTWTEFKVEPVEDGEYSNGTVTVTIDVTPDEENGPTFDWTSDVPVDAIFVKGGPGGLLYVYEPPATEGTGLHAPVNPNNDKFYGLSHISFCYGEHDSTTTTEKHDSTTTSEKHESTTTSEKHETTTTSEKHETTTTMADETTTTMADESTTTMADVTTTVPGDELPRTGNNTGPLVALGAMLLAGGTALVAGTKWRRAQQ